MKQVATEKYNIAWFKLAEFVARGEKERALALYRLLVHSFDDKALAYQLEGDLLLSFNDDAAIDRYCIAAQLYHKQGRLIESAAIYEHLVTLDPENINYLLPMLQQYKMLSYSSHFIKNFIVLANVYVTKQQLDKLIALLQQYERMFVGDEKCKIFQEVVFLLAQGDHDADFVEDMLCQTIDLLAKTTKELHAFLIKLEAVNKPLHQKAMLLLQL